MHIFNERISSKQKEKISKFATAAVAILLTFVLCVQPLGYSAYAVELEENDADVAASDSSSVEAEASANDDAAATVAESAATVGLELAEQATLTYNDNVFANTDESFEVPANQELDFTVAANDGYQVSAVKTVAGDVEADLAADENGVYKVDADQVTNDLTIKVEVTAVADNDAAGIATMSADDEVATLAAGDNYWTYNRVFGFYTGTLTIGNHVTVDGVDLDATTSADFSTFWGSSSTHNVSDLAASVSGYAFDHAEYKGDTIQRFSNS